MTITLTLNEITLEQADMIMDVLRADNAITKMREKSETSGRTDTVEAPEEYEDISLTADEEETNACAIEEVRAALQKLSKSKGKEAAKAVLTKFGVTKVTELKAEQYAAVMKEAG